jgi:plastocyanin
MREDEMAEGRRDDRQPPGRGPGRRTVVTAFRAAAVVALLTGLPTTALAADASVAIEGFAFSPQAVTVQVGDSVTWTNNDAVAHSATANGGSFDTGTIGGGTSKSVTFGTAGSFAYHCNFHLNMTGTVTVRAAVPAPTPRPTPRKTAPTGPRVTNPPTDMAPGASGSTGSTPAAALAVLAAVAVGCLAVRRRVVRRQGGQG